MLGLSLVLLIATLFSLRPKRIKWRLVVICLFVNFVLAIFVTRVPGAKEGVSCLMNKARWAWLWAEVGLKEVGAEMGVAGMVRKSFALFQRNLDANFYEKSCFLNFCEAFEFIKSLSFDCCPISDDKYDRPQRHLASLAS